MAEWRTSAEHKYLERRSCDARAEPLRKAGRGGGCRDRNTARGVRVGNGARGTPFATDAGKAHGRSLGPPAGTVSGPRVVCCRAISPPELGGVLPAAESGGGARRMGREWGRAGGVRGGCGPRPAGGGGGWGRWGSDPPGVDAALQDGVWEWGCSAGNIGRGVVGVGAGWARWVGGSCPSPALPCGECWPGSMRGGDGSAWFHPGPPDRTVLPDPSALP